MASIERVCSVMGPSPSTFVKSFDAKRDGTALKTFVHRWIRGADVIGLLVVLQRMIKTHGSIEQWFAAGYSASDEDLATAIEQFSRSAISDPRLAIPDSRLPINEPRNPGTAEPRNLSYFFARPSTGSACKRMNLFLRWMVRHDAVDPGGWTLIPASKLLVPLDTHTIRVGKCLRLTKRASPGWKMAADITAALRRLDPSDPVRYDFALCHLGMMGSCGYGTKQGSTQCALKAHCHPKPRVE
jgi:uncharacterized protein (TIGR02757 family)